VLSTQWSCLLPGVLGIPELIWRSDAFVRTLRSPRSGVSHLDPQDGPANFAGPGGKPHACGHRPISRSGRWPRKAPDRTRIAPGTRS